MSTQSESLNQSYAPDVLTLNVSEDYYLGNAQFIVFVDGQQVGGVQTATASHAAGQWQDVTLTGDFGLDPSQVAVEFLNDAWGGSSATDRNLYVDSLTLDGMTLKGDTAVNQAGGLTSGDAAALNTDGAVTFNLPPPSQTLELSVSEDAYQGNAQFVVLVDGKQVGGVQTATASHAAGQWQNIMLTGNFGPDPSQVAVKFINDAWGGSAATDRNLYVASLTYDGTTLAGDAAVNQAGGYSSGSAAALNTNGAVTFTLPQTADGVSFQAGDYITAGNVLQYDSNQSWSALATVDIQSPPPGPSQNLPNGGADLIFGNTNGAPYQGYEVWVDDNGNPRVRIMESFLGGEYIDVAGTTDIADGKQHTIGVSYDGSSKAAGVSLYVDGVAEPTKVLSDSLSGSSASNGPFILGNQLNGWQDQFEMRGQMDSFDLSDVVRPPSYFSVDSGAAPAIDSSTQLAYRFTDGSGLNVTDLSGHSHTGILSNSTMWTA